MVALVRVGDLSAISSAELSQDLHFDKYARQILENGKNVAASTPTITTLSGSEFWQKLSASLINSIPVHSLKHSEDLTSTTTASMPISHMDFDIIPNRVVIDSSNFGAMDELQKQLEYDKFMNEVWIGIVFTLILISMVFCICSCFLYHQFRTWKRNYNATVAQSQTLDIESMKLNPEHEDPVPEYTLVSGLPSYEAALELLHKTPNSCVLLYPSVYNVFNKHEKSSNDLTELTQQLQQLTHVNESSRPLMAAQAIVKSALPQHNNNSTSNNIPSYAEATTPTTVTMTAVTEKSAKHTIELPAVKDTTTTSVTYAILQKVPSYEEALLVKSDSCL